MVAAMKRMECDYEVRTIESLPLWDSSYQLPYIDYKLITVGFSMGEMRQALNIYVS